MFNASFDVLLYDLTSTYFEIDAAAVPEGDKRRHGYSRDKRPDCPQWRSPFHGALPHGVLLERRGNTGRLAAGLRGLGGQHERLQDAAELPWQDRSAVRQGRAPSGEVDTGSPPGRRATFSGGHARAQNRAPLLLAWVVCGEFCKIV